MEIAIDSLSKSFGRVKALDDLSLRIGPGERIALVGANGAGKTTLFRCLLGEYRHCGAITIDGLSPRRDRHAVLKRVGFVPQLPPPMTAPVADLIAFAAAVSGCERRPIVALAERLGFDLTDVARRPFAKLSGGQKKKLLIAIALGRGAELLILDEPTANLDPAARATLFAWLAEQPQATMIVSSHRLDEVSALATRLIELDHGRVALDERRDTQLSAAPWRAAIRLAQSDDGFAKAVSETALKPEEDGRLWRGELGLSDYRAVLAALASHAGVVREARFAPPETGDLT